MSQFELLCGDSLELLRQADDEQVRCVVSSPPYYGLRDYLTGHWEGGDPNCKHRYANPQRGTATDGSFADERSFEEGARPMLGSCRWCGAQRVDLQVGLEPSVEAYVQRLVLLFREVHRVLTKDGTVWLNLGDSYVTRPGQGTRGGATKQSSTLEGGIGNDGGSTELAQTKKQQNQAARCAMHRFRGEGIDFDPKAKNGLTREGDRPNRRNEMPGFKHKDLIGVPWRVAFALQADGWYLRTDIIWGKMNATPESVKDRPTRSHEYVFLLSKSPRYYYDYKALREPATYGNHPRIVVNNTPPPPPGAPPHVGLRTYNLRKNDSPELAARSDDGKRVRGFQERWDRDEAKGEQSKLRNKRDVWMMPSQPYKGAHFAVMPERLVEPCVLAGSAAGDLVMDPFCGSGTVGVVALRHGRNFVGLDLNAQYLELARERIEKAEAKRLKETA